MLTAREDRGGVRRRARAGAAGDGRRRVRGTDAGSVAAGALPGGGRTTGAEVTAHAASGAGDANFVRLVVGDRVDVELTPNDRGRAARIVTKL